MPLRFPSYPLAVRLLLSPLPSPTQPCLTGYHGINPRLRLSEYIFMCLHFIIYIRCNPVFHLALCCLAREAVAAADNE